VTGLSRELLKRRMSEFVVENVLSAHHFQAVEQGLLHVHPSLPHFRAALLIPELREVWAEDNESYMLRLASILKGSSALAAELCLPNFAEDIGLPLLRRFEPGRLASVLEQLFSFFRLPPRYRVSINFGDELENEALFLAETVLKVLDQGATFLEPQIVVRVRRGRNLERESRGFRVLYRALDLARTREGISFALLDSPLNRSLGGLVAYTANGLRAEPDTLDFYRGTRGQYIGGIVSINVPKALSFGQAGLQEALDTAARILATALELCTTPGGREAAGAISLVINLSGISSYRISHELFEVLDFLSQRTKELRRRYRLNFVLASTGQKIPFCHNGVDEPRHQRTSALLANMEQYLPGGHCLWISAGAHKTAEELYAELLIAAEKGISFVRFSVEDVRCFDCHLVIAAPGPCPSCASIARRKTVDDEEGLLEMTGDGRTFLSSGED